MRTRRSQTNIVYERPYTRSEKTIRSLRYLITTFGNNKIAYSGEGLDSVAVKIYGSGNESRWRQVADNNADYLIGWGGDLSKIDKLRV